MQEKTKTLAEFKAELLSELRSEFEPRIRALESGYGELKGLLAKPAPVISQVKDELVTCPECGKQIKSSNLASHRERIHKVKG